MTMKQILQVENGSVEFENQEELERYLKGESPKLELISDGVYKAIFDGE